MLASQYLIIRQKLTKFLALEGKKKLNNYLYAANICCCAEPLIHEALLYAYTFNYFEMNWDGTTTGKDNYITDTEFLNIVKKVERICGEIEI